MIDVEKNTSNPKKKIKGKMVTKVWRWKEEDNENISKKKANASFKPP